MKKLTILFIVTYILFSIGVKETHANRVNAFNDLTTLNFQEKLPYVRLETIKRICSYDYCDYLVGKDLTSALDAYVNRYLKTKNNVDINKIKKEGLKITEIVLEN